jgi:hypothetical protein
MPWQSDTQAMRKYNLLHNAAGHMMQGHVSRHNIHTQQSHGTFDKREQVFVIRRVFGIRESETTCFQSNPNVRIPRMSHFWKTCLLIPIQKVSHKIRDPFDHRGCSDDQAKAPKVAD